MKRGIILIGLCLISALSACTVNGVKQAAQPFSLREKILRVDGYSQFDNSGQLTVNHRWLSAQHLAKLNAYRSLAEQLYFEPLGPNKTVGSQVISNEIYRTYLDIYLRGARATDYRVFSDRLKTSLELKLTPRFYQCMGSDATQTNQCIQEDGKLTLTRLGYRPATIRSVNLACGASDCSDQFYVKGFSKRQGPIDDVLLDNGFYDMEWTVNTGLRILLNYLLTYGLPDVL
ncbi:MAG: hypothetical protein ACU836_08790 [Gammaproteobacteria bacterium]